MFSISCLLLTLRAGGQSIFLTVGRCVCVEEEEMALDYRGINLRIPKNVNSWRRIWYRILWSSAWKLGDERHSIAGVDGCLLLLWILFIAGKRGLCRKVCVCALVCVVIFGYMCAFARAGLSFVRECVLEREEGGWLLLGAWNLELGDTIHMGLCKPKLSVFFFWIGTNPLTGLSSSLPSSDIHKRRHHDRLLLLLCRNHLVRGRNHSPPPILYPQRYLLHAPVAAVIWHL